MSLWRSVERVGLTLFGDPAVLVAVFFRSCLRRDYQNHLACPQLFLPQFSSVADMESGAGA